MTKPTLLYDGDCAFCQYCADYLKQITQDEVRYTPYQQDTLGRPTEACQKAIQLVISDKQYYEGAAAGFKTLSYGRSNRGWWLYQNLPGYAQVTEEIYQLISTHRNLCHSMAKSICGNPWQVGRLTIVLWGVLFLSLFFVLLVF